MSDQHKDQPAAENPEELAKLKVSDPKTWAAGIPGVMAALSDVFTEAGAVISMGVAQGAGPRLEVYVK